ncbi:hypothetical protein HZH68_015809 [Vespula germanica]|uniref:Uncharacterized protein n=1 Tax=Vespula germanica TaxID=30212 RepID=A0A834J4Q3_VESGE|nr:hypothetical protein HZH68_015809 [Vespula germanica]
MISANSSQFPSVRFPDLPSLDRREEKDLLRFFSRSRDFSQIAETQGKYRFGVFPFRKLPCFFPPAVVSAAVFRGEDRYDIAMPLADLQIAWVVLPTA